MKGVGVVGAVTISLIAWIGEVHAEGLSPKILSLVGQWSARVEKSDLSIEREGKTIAEIHAYELQLGISGMPVGAVSGVGDITGDATPEFVVLERTSSRECCSRLRVYELGERLTEYPALNLGTFAPLRFENVDGLPGLELPAIDLTFAGWGSRDLLSPAIRVVFKPRAGRWEFLRKNSNAFQPPSEELLQAMRDKLKSTEPSHGAQDLPSILTSTLVDVVYQGFPKEARKILDNVWEPARPGKQDYINLMAERMRQSPGASFLEPEVREFLDAD